MLLTPLATTLLLCGAVCLEGSDNPIPSSSRAAAIAALDLEIDTDRGGMEEEDTRERWKDDW